MEKVHSSIQMKDTSYSLGGGVLVLIAPTIGYLYPTILGHFDPPFLCGVLVLRVQK